MYIGDKYRGYKGILGLSTMAHSWWVIRSSLNCRKVGVRFWGLRAWGVGLSPIGLGLET